MEPENTTQNSIQAEAKNFTANEMIRFAMKMSDRPNTTQSYDSVKFALEQFKTGSLVKP